ncbi:hypothetical protein ACIBAI_23945 [Streptomyces sp. NPDC051041]
MRARRIHVTGIMLRKVARQVADALREPPATSGEADRDGSRDG